MRSDSECIFCDWFQYKYEAYADGPYAAECTYSGTKEITRRVYKTIRIPFWCPLKKRKWRFPLFERVLTSDKRRKYEDRAVRLGSSRVVIPPRYYAIDDKAFFRRKDIKEVLIPQGVEVVGILAFAGCKSLVKVTLPQSIKSIGVSAFEDCKSLTDLSFMSLPEELEEIKERTFADCVALESIVIPKNVKKIGKEAFAGCYSLKNVDMPDGDIVIEDDAFLNCKSLEM